MNDMFEKNEISLLGEIVVHTEPSGIFSIVDFEVLEQALNELVEEYSKVVISEDQVRLAKKERATYERVKKDLNAFRLQKEREYLKAFEEQGKFQTKCLTDLIDKIISGIDNQVKQFDWKKRVDKMEEAQKFWEEKNPNPSITFEMIRRNVWGNATCTKSEMQHDILEIIKKNVADITTIRQLSGDDLLLCENSCKIYADSDFDLNRTITYIEEQKALIAKISSIKQENEKAEKETIEKIIEIDEKFNPIDDDSFNPIENDDDLKVLYSMSVTFYAKNSQSLENLNLHLEEYCKTCDIQMRGDDNE